MYTTQNTVLNISNIPIITASCIALFSENLLYIRLFIYDLDMIAHIYFHYIFYIIIQSSIWFCRA